MYSHSKVEQGQDTANVGSHTSPKKTALSNLKSKNRYILILAVGAILLLAAASFYASRDVYGIIDGQSVSNEDFLSTKETLRSLPPYMVQYAALSNEVGALVVGFDITRENLEIDYDSVTWRELVFAQALRSEAESRGLNVEEETEKYLVSVAPEYIDEASSEKLRKHFMDGLDWTSQDVSRYFGTEMLRKELELELIDKRSIYGVKIDISGATTENLDENVRIARSYLEGRVRPWMLESPDDRNFISGSPVDTSDLFRGSASLDLTDIYFDAEPRESLVDYLQERYQANGSGTIFTSNEGGAISDLYTSEDEKSYGIYRLDYVNGAPYASWNSLQSTYAEKSHVYKGASDMRRYTYIFESIFN